MVLLSLFFSTSNLKRRKFSDAENFWYAHYISWAFLCFEHLYIIKWSSFMGNDVMFFSQNLLCAAFWRGTLTYKERVGQASGQGPFQSRSCCSAFTSFRSQDLLLQADQTGWCQIDGAAEWNVESSHFPINQLYKTLSHLSSKIQLLPWWRFLPLH